MLTCEEARRILWPLDRPRQFVAAEEPARAHLAECAVCRAFFRADAELSALVERHGGVAWAPAELRARIIDALAWEEQRDALEPWPVPGEIRPGKREGRSDPGDEAPAGHRPRSRTRTATLAAALVMVALPVALLIAGDGADPPRTCSCKTF